MITASERPPNETHPHRTRPRDRPPRQPKPRKPKPKPKQTTEPEPESDEGWFTIRDIIDEKTERGRILYLIDWEGVDQNGRRYDPTWVCHYPLNAPFHLRIHG